MTRLERRLRARLLRADAARRHPAGGRG
jgi:hypothetical protein